MKGSEKLEISEMKKVRSEVSKKKKKKDTP